MYSASSLFKPQLVEPTKVCIIMNFIVILNYKMVAIL